MIIILCYAILLYYYYYYYYCYYDYYVNSCCSGRCILMMGWVQTMVLGHHRAEEFPFETKPSLV